MKNTVKTLLLMAFLLVTFFASAKMDPSVKKRTAVSTKALTEQCRRGSSSAELNINNVRTRINVGGNMWLATGNLPAYYVPSTGNATALYCGALWIGGEDENSQLRVAAMTFGSYGEDFWPGPLAVDGTASVTSDVCNKYDRHYIITRRDVEQFVAMARTGNIDPSKVPQVIQEWPANGTGNQSHYLAPYYSAAGDGANYDWRKGDYPYYDLEGDLCPKIIKAGLPAGTVYHPIPTNESKFGTDGAGENSKNKINGGILTDQVLKGDQTIWWIFNDMGNAHTESKSDNPIGLEIRAQAFAFTTNDEINNMTFYSYEIINRSTYTLMNTYFSQWVDADLGYAKDDYVGCDVKRGLGYCYNGKTIDGPGDAAYAGNPPAVGIDFFQGPYMDPDGRDNPKVDIGKYKNDPRFAADFKNYVVKKKGTSIDSTDANGNTFYDTVSITDNAELFYRSEDGGAWYFQKDDFIGNCAINGVNFGNGIADDERFGMRRFVYHDIGNKPYGDPTKAIDYYNYLRGIWRDNQRMVFGGNGRIDESKNYVLDCDFMFPGDSDPWNWGTNGIKPNPALVPWTEQTSGFTYGDRRFMQSAGPFTLKPGAVNYITVGIPWAQANSGGPWASVELLRKVDDKCQALFDNCFQILEGPDAPTIVAQELSNQVILYLSYKNVESNNYQEKYSRIDPTIPQLYEDQTKILDTTLTYRVSNGKVDSTKADTSYVFGQTPYKIAERSYVFEGYQIYQMVDANASVADIYNTNKAKLVAQCDIENYYDSTSRQQPIAMLTNYTSTDNGGMVDEVKVRGANVGLKHSFNIKEDAFATGNNKKLINNKAYYYIAIAYAQNNFKQFNINGAVDGQKTQYLASRKREDGQSITAITVIPHDPSSENGGTIVQAAYGVSPQITRIEGRGNAGIALQMDTASFKSARDNGFIQQPVYQINAGPLNVRVIDPLNVKSGKYYIHFTGVDNSSKWFITSDNETSGKKDTIWGDVAIGQNYENLLLDLGISVQIQNVANIATSDSLTSSVSLMGGPGFVNGGEVIKGALLSSSLTFVDPMRSWLSGVPDNDASAATNWIRAGKTVEAATGRSNYYGNSCPEGDSLAHVQQDYYYTLTSKTDAFFPIDPNKEFGSILGGTWAPYRFASNNTYHPAFSPYYFMNEATASSKERRALADPLCNTSLVFSRLNNLASVDIVFTNNTDYWTRCPIVEMSEDSRYSEGGARKFQLRKSASVDKRGIPHGQPGCNEAEASLISETGMGWFPGYAINIETGERLNVFFGEDSRYPTANGRDMIWNPTSSSTDSWGGKHYVYVVGSNKSYIQFANGAPARLISSPRYDQGQWAYDHLKTLTDNLVVREYTNSGLSDAYSLFANVMWVGAPVLSDKSFESTDPVQIIQTDATIKLRVRKPYAVNWTNSDDKADPAQNNNNPMYLFEMVKEIVTLTNQATNNNKDLQNAIMNKITVVPNPYYAHSEYEKNQLDNRVRITNLPAGSQVTVYSLDGTVIRRFNATSTTQPNTNSTDSKAVSQTTLDWDLKNQSGLPIAGGTYLIYVKAPGIGEKVIKWFGVVSPTDLNSYN